MFGLSLGLSKKENRFFWAVLLVLLILVLILFWYILDISCAVKSKDKKIEPTSMMEKNKAFLDLSNTDPEVGGVVEKVSRHILLPAKQFTVATVKDADKLIQEDPVLFRYIQNGQRLLIYEAGAIVYDPLLDKVVDVIQYYPIRLQQLKEAVSSTLQ
ncbi:MAG: hypothetical protein HY980_00940 [Candidatus Magasanikbacteria bacterium]|nr:hypothetical protein [Candidatus Magasanikbacteria bacterium]